jgi:antitoxin YefM
MYSFAVQVPDTRMAIETTYTQARANLKALLDEVAENREQVIIHRRDGDDVAMIAADELRGLIETAHLLRSPKNAQRLMQALRRAQSGHGRAEPVEKLRAELGLDDEE